MSNPQINTLKKQGTLVSVQENIIDILKKYTKGDIAKRLCSHEILGLANASTIKAIADGIYASAGITIKDNGYTLPSTWIGSVASDLYNQQKISCSNKICSYNAHDDEAWYS